jgi:hypothetical protein
MVRDAKVRSFVFMYYTFPFAMFFVFTEHDFINVGAVRGGGGRFV